MNLAPVTLLVGRNNSGKSTVGEAIVRAAAQISTGRGGKRVDSLGRPRESFWQTNRQEDALTEQLWYRGEKTQRVRVVLRDDHFKVEYSIDGDTGEGASITVAEEPSFVEMAPRVTAFLPSMALRDTRETNLWKSLLLQRADKMLTAAMSEIFELHKLEAIQQLPDGHLWLLFEDYSVPLESQGDGARAALRCLMPLALLEDTLYVIEEPEVHQHPGSLERYARAICRFAKQQCVQLLVTTHSLECVRAFLDGAETAQSESALVHLRLEHGILDARRLTADAVRSLTDQGADVRKLDI